MPTVAQKLCHEIVEPILAPSSNDIARSMHSRKSFKAVSGNPIRYAKPTRSIVVEKKKVITQLEPTSKTILNKLQSKERIFKKDFTDIGVNTIISGPLRCDNNCVTNVRRRDYHCSCKNQKSLNYKGSSKQVQTLNKTCSRSDKACTHCIETANCGTQFFENSNSRLRTQISNRLLLKRSHDFEPHYSYRNTLQPLNPSNRNSKTINFNPGKRWALSSYPSRGPDF